jgi:hypothetical protein
MSVFDVSEDDVPGVIAFLEVSNLRAFGHGLGEPK